ncbi:hypothetical protein KR044_002401 [Drosophila immigrans]|nr:hypothetical protein KR044_002401 [Drosophila immigrans]
MSFMLESLESLTFERSKIWANFLTDCEKIENGEELDVSVFEDLFVEQEDEDDEEQSMLEYEEAEEDVVEDDINNTTQCMTHAELTQMLSSGSNKELLDQTMPIVEEHMRKWREAGLDRILNTFDAGKIERHVGGWMRRNNSCYVAASAPSSSEDMDDSDDRTMHPVETPRYIYSSCKRSASAIKMCHKRPEPRGQFACEQSEEQQHHHHQMQSLIQRRKQQHRRQRERERIFHTSPRHFSCSMRHKSRKCRDVSRRFPTSSSSSEDELMHSRCECSACTKRAFSQTAAAHPYYGYRKNYHSRSLRDWHRERREQRFELESRSFSNNVYCKRSMRRPLHRQAAFEDDRRPRLIENKCGCCNSERLCSDVVHLANSSTEDWVVENKSSPDVLPFETPKSSSSRPKTSHKRSAARSKTAIKPKLRSVDEEYLFEPHKLSYSSNTKANIRPKVRDDELFFEPHKTTIGSSKKKIFREDEEFRFEPRKASYSNNSKALITTKIRADDEALFEPHKASLSSNSKSIIKTKIRAEEQFLFEPHKASLNNSSNKTKVGDNEELLFEQLKATKAPIKTKIRTDEGLSLEPPKASMSNNSKAPKKIKIREDAEPTFEQQKPTSSNDSKSINKTKSKEDEEHVFKEPKAISSNYSKLIVKTKSKEDEEHVFKEPKAISSNISKSIVKTKSKEDEEHVFKEPKAALSNNSKSIIQTKNKEVQHAFVEPKAPLSNDSKLIIKAKSGEDEEHIFVEPKAPLSNSKSKASVTFSVPSTPKSTTKPRDTQKSAKKEDQLQPNVTSKDIPKAVASPRKTTRKPKVQATAKKEKTLTKAASKTETVKAQNKLPANSEIPNSEAKAVKAVKEKKPPAKNSPKMSGANKTEMPRVEDEISDLDEELQRVLVLSEKTYEQEREKWQQQAAAVNVKTDSPQLPEQSMFNNHSVACNSTALTNDTASCRVLKPEKVAEMEHCIDLCSPESSRNPLEADTDCTMVTSTTMSCESVAAAERPQLKISKKGVLLYEPQQAESSGQNHSVNSSQNFTLSERTLSPIIGKRRARKFFKYYTGKCSFDSNYYVYYCPPGKLLAAIKNDSKSLDLDSSSSSSCDDDLEIVASLGVIHTEVDK